MTALLAAMVVVKLLPFGIGEHCQMLMVPVMVAEVAVLGFAVYVAVFAGLLLL